MTDEETPPGWDSNPSAWSERLPIVALALVGEWEGASFDDVIATFDNGGSYVNVHTEAYPAGEIRGQIVAQDD